MDDDSLINIISVGVITKIGIDASRMTLVLTPLIGIKGSTVPVKRAVKWTVTIGIAPYYVTIQETFMFINTHLLYNAIIRRPMLH
jgi:hypothetical protein